MKRIVTSAYGETERAMVLDIIASNNGVVINEKEEPWSQYAKLYTITWLDEVGDALKQAEV